MSPSPSSSSNPKRKVYYGIIALAVTALIVDKVFFAENSAVATAAAAEAPEVNKPKPATTTAAVSASADIARRINLASQNLPEQTPDAFAVPLAWRPKAPAPVVVVKPAEPDRPRFDPDARAARHKVSAISGEIARINGINVRAGDVLPTGETIIRIEKQCLTLRTPEGEEFRVAMQDPARAPR